MAYLGLLGGFVILLFSGDLLVRGAVALAVRLGIPALIIGLTVVAFGTSAPELVVSVKAAVTGSPGISIGNVVGSNIANVLLVLGLPAMIAPTRCNEPFIGRNTFYVVGASILFIVLCFYGPLAMWHGAFLFSLIILFLIESGRRAGNGRQNKALMEEAEEEVENIDGVAGLPETEAVTTGFIVAGLIGLPIGAHLIVESGTTIAINFGISEAAVGLTIIALGTSLPELATTMSAAMRGHAGLAVGNVLGSNLFNMLVIMGVTAMLAPVPIPETFLRYDLWIMLAASIAIVPFALMRGSITRVPAAAFVTCYVAYIAFVFAPHPDAIAAAITH